MALQIDVLFDPDLHPAEDRPAQAVQLLGDILPYVFAKYRLMPVDRLKSTDPWSRTRPPNPRPR